MVDRRLRGGRYGGSSHSTRWPRKSDPNTRRADTLKPGWVASAETEEMDNWSPHCWHDGKVSACPLRDRRIDALPESTLVGVDRTATAAHTRGCAGSGGPSI